VERAAVNRSVGGSNPSVGADRSRRLKVRMTGFQSVDVGFNSHREQSRTDKANFSVWRSLASARASGARGGRFESFHADWSRRFQISNFKFQISNSGSRISNLESEIWDLKSEIPPRVGGRAANAAACNTADPTGLRGFKSLPTHSDTPVTPSVPWRDPGLQNRWRQVRFLHGVFFQTDVLMVVVAQMEERRPVTPE
jgi:hypothetical protein